MNQVDVPSPINLQEEGDAKKWERSAMQRPFRRDFIEAFGNELQIINRPSLKVLELGSGPGFLACELLMRFNDLEITLLDYSIPMHELAKKRIGANVSRVKFVNRNFKQAEWPSGLGTYGVVITNQAVHELRHKRHAFALHEYVKSLIKVGGVYLVCDHFYGQGGMSDDQLYMSVEEQRQCLVLAGFKVRKILEKGSLVLHRATRL